MIEEHTFSTKTMGWVEKKPRNFSQAQGKKRDWGRRDQEVIISPSGMSPGN